MERIDDEVRDRIRATALWLVAGLTLLGVLLGLWAIYVGFLRTVVAAADVVSISDDGRTVTVELRHNSCQEPAGVEVDEQADVVVLTAYVTERAPLRDRACRDAGVVARDTVALEAPVGDRELRTTTP